MGYIELALAVFQLIFKVWDSVTTANQELKQKKQEALNAALDALHQKDKSAFTAALNAIDRL